MLSDMKDRVELGHFRSLNPMFFQQPRVVKSGQCFVHCSDCFSQKRQQFVARGVTSVKLSLALSPVSFAAKTADNPLPGVPANVQDQVADTV